MSNKTFINTLPFAEEKEIYTLVENKRSFFVDHLELHVFETYQAARAVPLQFDDMVLINMIQGDKVIHLKNLKAFEYKKGQMLLLPAYTSLAIEFPSASLEEPTQCTALVVSRERLDYVMNYINEFMPNHQLVSEWKFDPNSFHLYNTPEIVELLDKLFKMMMSNNQMKNVFTDIYFKELVIKLLQVQSLLALEISHGTDNILLHIKEFICKHITEKLTVEQLQRVANMSKSSLTRLFKDNLGVSPMEFVIRERLKRAKHLLRVTRSVKESCFGAGFNDVNYFVRLFKNREGITPGAFMLQI